METSVLIIGGGATGTGLARDLSLRGIDCILIDQKDLNSGASGANHGLLHSGARYVFKDRETAVECQEESRLLKKLAPHCIEDTGGLFVAVDGDDDDYIAGFPRLCTQAGITAIEMDPKEALEKEPCLAPNIKAAFAVNDAAVDPFMLSFDNAADAQNHGAKILRHTQVTGFDMDKGKILAARVKDTLTGETFTIAAKEFVNASGAWAGQVAALAGAKISIRYSKGSLLITQSRINDRVINRLRPASDADILVPGGTVSIIGTTSIKIDDLEDIRPTAPEVDDIIRIGAQMVPALKTARYIRAYAGVRPLVIVGSDKEGGRSISRNFTLATHEEDQLDNFVTITGGKLTTFRLMAEKAADVVAARLKNTQPCLTAVNALPASAKGEWTEPGRAPRVYMANPERKDTLICECEMVSEAMVDQIVADLKQEGGIPTLEEVGHRSRIGKGPCQGTFCSFRLAAYLYRKGELEEAQGMGQVRDFVNERWKGFLPLVRDKELMRVELQEAFLCGLFGMDEENESND